MAESFVALPPDSTGKKQRTVTFDPGTGDVHQEVVTLAAPDGTLTDPLRRTEGLPAGSNLLGTVGLAPGTSFVGYMGSYEDDASKQGRYRFAGAKVATSVVTPNASITLTNPAGSLVDLILTRYQVEVDASADVVLVVDAISTGPVQANLNPNQRTTVSNPGEVRAGAGVLTGGTQASLIRRANTQSPVAVGPFRFRITPGRSFTVRFLGPGAANTVWFGMGWFVVNEGADLA